MDGNKRRKVCTLAITVVQDKRSSDTVFRPGRGSAAHYQTDQIMGLSMIIYQAGSVSKGFKFWMTKDYTHSAGISFLTGTPRSGTPVMEYASIVAAGQIVGHLSCSRGR